MSRKPEHSKETDFATLYKTIETTLCEKDKEKIEVIEAPMIPYSCDKCHYKTNMHRILKRHKIIHLKPEEIQYFCCYHCTYKSSQKHTLKRHIFQHFRNKEVTFHCYSCDFMTVNRDFIIEHIKKHAHVKLHKLSHKIQTEKYRCDKCNYNTFRCDHFNRHKITHLKREKIQYFYCYHCFFKTKRKYGLKIHISRHFKNEEVRFYCYICDFMTLKRDLIIEHLKKHAQVKLHKLSYKIQTEKYRCDKCNYNTFCRRNLNRHKITHLKPEESQYFYCYHCSHKSKNKHSLKFHISMHFNNENVPFYCYICDFMTPKRDLIIEHLKKHAQVKLHKLSYKIQTEKYRCDKCNYKTFIRQSLNKHKLTHLKPEEIQYFYCYHCSHKFKHKYSLKVHISMHFNNENVPFHCYICDFMTLKRDLIIGHINKHAQVKLHNLSYKIQTEKYRCDKCNYDTFRRYHFNRHKITHLKPKEIQYFYCCHCSYQSNRKDNIKRHINRHFKNENVAFHCYICDFMTPKRDLIAKHIQKHSKVQIKSEIKEES